MNKNKEVDTLYSAGGFQKILAELEKTSFPEKNEDESSD